MLNVLTKWLLSNSPVTQPAVGESFASRRVPFGDLDLVPRLAVYKMIGYGSVGADSGGG